MARKLRVEYAGAVYHVMSRGDRREPIFLDDADRRRFFETLTEACLKTGWCIHAAVLMPNHVHLVIETPAPNLVAGMKWLLGTYTIRFNRRHALSGHLFAGRYKALIVDGTDRGYLRTVCDYVHLNPARAGLISNTQPLRAFAWSTWPAYLMPAKRPAWLRVERLLGEWNIPRDSPAGRKELEQIIESRRTAELTEEFAPVRRGWCFGGDAFREELLGLAAKGLGAEHYGEARAQTAEAHAERIAATELRRRRLRRADLAALPKGAPAKLTIATRLRAETTVPVAWIANRLHMGSRAYVNHLLYRERKLANNKN